MLFNTVVQERKHSVLLLENTGTTVMYYRWQQIERDNALGRLADDRQRFFLDFEPGVVLPGECRELTISYLSPNPGVFSESWQLLVQPWAEKEVPQLSLCGVTDRVDVNKTLREAIEVCDKKSNGPSTQTADSRQQTGGRVTSHQALYKCSILNHLLYLVANDALNCSCFRLVSGSVGEAAHGKRDA